MCFSVFLFHCSCVCVCVCVCVSVPSLSLQSVRAPEEAQQLVLDGGVEAHVQPVDPHRLQLAVQHHHIHLIGREGEVAVDAHGPAPGPVVGASAGAALRRDGHLVHLETGRGGIRLCIHPWIVSLAGGS